MANLVEAARITYGTPDGREAQVKVEEWLEKHCRDWRYESGALQGPVAGGYSPMVVSAVFSEPLEFKKLQMIISQQVKRWNLQRARRNTESLVPMSIDSYADGPLGHKMKAVVDGIMVDIKMRNNAQKQKKEQERRERMEKFAKVLVAVKQRAVDRKLKGAMEKLRHTVDEAQGLVDAALEQDFKRRRVEEDK